MFSLAVQLVCAFLPWGIRRRILCGALGFRIDVTARIGRSLLLCKRLDMAAGSSIKNLTIIRGLDLVSLGENGRIGNLNWISGFPSGTGSAHFRGQSERRPALVVGDHASITNRHLLDCTSEVRIGRFSTLAGFRTQVLTHSIDIYESKQRSEAVVIGDYCFVGTACVLLGGARVPDYCVIGAGSVVNKALHGSYRLFAGVPAKPIKSLAQDAKYFVRERGHVE